MRLYEEPYSCDFQEPTGTYLLYNERDGYKVGNIEIGGLSFKINPDRLYLTEEDVKAIEKYMFEVKMKGKDRL